ncbi:MAG TPA: aspartate--tRNA ligase [Bacillota bacterium]|nr:aspartate--tRNA ligase [Bacillota bacterium]
MHQRALATQIDESNVNETVLLKGWVQRRRDLGGLIFIDLRDRSGVIQVIFNPDHSKEALNIADTVRNEYVIEVTGNVIKRSPENINQAMDTGKIEVLASEITIINRAKTPPFVIEEETDVSEDLRLKYRYIDLRRRSFQKTFYIRHQITQAIRNYLNENDFLEMETPILTKSTPEGARDYLVPSRVHTGSFYALPQSPQLFKQMIMMSGFEKYYQIARCFRDEDLRADRQPEFTQLDIETSFMTTEEIMELTEGLMASIMKEIKDIDVERPFKRMTYEEAMHRYGSDKPDTRFGMELIHINEVVESSEFKVFSGTIASGGSVALLNVKGAADKYSRRNIDDLTKFVEVYGAKGLAWVKVDADEFTGPIAKFINEEEQQGIRKKAQVEDGDLLLFVADKQEVVYSSLGALRLKLGKELQLINEKKFNFLWITDWPLFEYDDELGRYVSMHHPFTRPFEEHISLINEEPNKVKAHAYDLVLNGFELGGGSLRIYKRELQEKILDKLGFTKEEAEDQFGFLLEALEYGAPPHGGIAFGLDRMVMILAEQSNIRDTILFPKTASATDLLTDAPSKVDEEQLEELSLQLEQKNGVEDKQT